MREEGGGGTSVLFFREIPPEIVVESRDVFPNGLVTNETHSIIPLETVYTEGQTHPQ